MLKLKSRTLLTPSEVIYYAGLGGSFPRLTIRNIFTIEYQEARTLIGETFYAELLADLIEHSDVRNFTEFVIESDGTTNWEVGDNFVYNGILYTVKLKPDFTDDQIRAFYHGQTPEFLVGEDSGIFKYADKFSTEAFSRLWYDFMAEWLSWQVIANLLGVMHSQIRPEGIVKNLGKTYEHASDEEYHILHKACLANSERAYFNMNHYILSNNTDGVYDNYKPILEDGLSSIDDLSTINDKVKGAGYGRYYFG